MVLIIPGSFIVSIKGQCGGQDVVNVIGIRAAGQTAAAVAASVLASWKTSGGPLSKLPTTYQMIEVKAMSLNSVDGDVAVATDSSAGAGGSSIATTGACALVTFGNGTRNKSTKGRMYFGPLLETSINSDGRTLAAASTFTSAFTAFKAALTIGGMDWVVISRKNSSVASIVSINTQSVIATQRRRIR